MNRCLLLFCLLLCRPLAAQDFAWTPGLQRAYVDLLKLKVASARQTLTGEPVTNGMHIYTDDFADMVTLLVADEEQAFNQLAKREDQRLSQLQKLDSKSPWQRLMQAEVRLHWAFVKLKFGKEISASWDIIRAYKLLAENQKLYPSFIPTYKSLGVLHIMIGSVPENYTWVTNLLGLKGSIRQGLLEIQRAQQDPIFRTESQMIELLVRAYITQFTDADQQKLKGLVQEHPDNLLIHFFAGTTAMKNGRSEQALAYLLDRPSGPAYLAMPIIYNLLGDIYLQKGRYQQALQQYQQFLTTYRGQNFLKDSYYKQFLCYWLTNNDTRAIPLLQQVQQVGHTVVESDKAAQKFAESFFSKTISSQQKILMQARLATDGGYLDTALTLMRSYPEAHFIQLPDRAEYNYRLGRIYQRSHEPDQAIPCFERAIALSESAQLSFGATSALQLGYIYQQKRNIAKARQYFEKALSYKKHEYKNSVDNKARAGLTSLEE
ncbi:tetratricopeptide repeat protein [Nibrella viscosa]